MELALALEFEGLCVIGNAYFGRNRDDIERRKEIKNLVIRNDLLFHPWSAA